ncbi:uncharacterized protein LOC116192824 isoform X2 [Punica granatum]|uniref:Uncharacterized protein LOC116192824 isoform X2 n=2 Tax=Punica granatum TaxID=22663 RepID=A0A6P8C3S2_PUNGR|nr:uncharacterized protein LOC116192824 isoform X2 [Punica granatum]
MDISSNSVRTVTREAPTDTAMAPNKKTLPPCSPIHVGDCEVTIESSNFTYESDSNGLSIKVSRKAKINIAVKRVGSGNLIKNNEMGLSECGGEGKDQSDMSRGDEYSFALLNPKDADNHSTSLLQEVLKLYKKELPAMRFAANTGKESMFLERCISNGKYCTLIFKCKASEGLEEVLAAMTYQIVPADTQYAEIPTAAVSSTYQQKGIGRLLFLELRNRLQSVGVSTILCWGDGNSEGFWSKQGFVPIAEVDMKGRARRVPIRADIRRSLCFPGGSTLMVSHLNKSVSADPSDSTKSHVNQCKFFSSFACCKIQGFKHAGVNISHLGMTAKAEDFRPGTSVAGGFQTEGNRIGDISRSHGGEEDSIDPKKVDHDTILSGGSSANIDHTDLNQCQCSGPGNKRRIWEATLSSLKSKKVKGGHSTDCQLHSDGRLVKGSSEKDYYSAECSLGISRDDLLAETISKNPLTIGDVERSPRNCLALTRPSEALCSNELPSKGASFRIMLMNIADDSKKTHLTKVIEDLGGVVASQGSESTHIVTGKVRRTLNFCTGLCSGAWIVLPAWLKESFREGRFVDEVPFILEDEDYVLKYRSDLKGAVIRARASPRALLEGYHVCIAHHVHPPQRTLTEIVTAAGGNIIREADIVKDPSRTIFIACEEDMEVALVALRKGVWTFGSEWLMSCIMRQELDFEAPQFAVSL